MGSNYEHMLNVSSGLTLNGQNMFSLFQNFLPTYSLEFVI